MFGNTFENDLLKLIFNATAIANIADNAASSPLANLFLALHTADPGEAGDQTSSEATYTSYARLAVARTTGGWTVTNNEVVNAALAAFPQCTGGTNSIAFCSVGVASSGASKILARCPTGSTSVGKGFTAATSDTLTIPGNALVVDDRCVVHPTPNMTLPTGLTEGTIYWVKTSSGNDVTLSTTQGGATVDITAVGAGVISKIQLLAVANLITPQFTAGQLKFVLD